VGGLKCTKYSAKKFHSVGNLKAQLHQLEASSPAEREKEEEREREREREREHLLLY
jgi:hypothetical protein